MSSSECLTDSMALAASPDSVPPLKLDVVDALAKEASLGRGVSMEWPLLRALLSSVDDLPVLRCRSGRPAVSSSRLGWPMSLLAAGLSICQQQYPRLMSSAATLASVSTSRGHIPTFLSSSIGSRRAYMQHIHCWHQP